MATYLVATVSAISTQSVTLSSFHLVVKGS